MKSWKIAVGLAAMGAIATPFIIGTWRPSSNTQRWIALTAEARANLLAEMERSKNCRFYETQVEARDALGLTPEADDISQAVRCHSEQEVLNGGGRMERYFSRPRYLAINGAISLASFVGIFGLANILPGVFRRYRQRLIT